MPPAATPSWKTSVCSPSKASARVNGDVKAKALGVPLYELLGGRVRERVVCYPHVRGRTTAELVDDAKRKVAEGWKFVRFDPRPEEDGVTFEPAAAVRDVCRHFDLSYGKGMDDEIANWLATKRSDERGAHKYDAEMYGLRKGDILDQYSGYIENFEVKVRAA